jgi:hypothetical protein
MTAQRGPASSVRRDVVPDQHTDALPRNRAMLSSQSAPEMIAAQESPGPPACLHRLVSQVAEQRQGQGPKVPKGLDRHWHEGQGGGHLPIRAPLGGVPGNGRKPGVRAAPPAKGAAAGWMTETSPNTSRRGNTSMTSPRAPGPRGGGTPRGAGEQKGTPGPREKAGLSGSAGAAAGASAGAS